MCTIESKPSLKSNQPPRPAETTRKSENEIRSSIVARRFREWPRLVEKGDTICLDEDGKWCLVKAVANVECRGGAV